MILAFFFQNDGKSHIGIDKRIACIEHFLMKFYVKLGRQTGVHVSPSVLVNGLAVDTSSGWTREEWFAFFDRVLGESS